MEILTCEQGSPEWQQARCGIVTCSELNAVMSQGRGKAESKTRRTYMLKLIGEALTGAPADSGYTNVHMERGREQEPEAIAAYEFSRDVTVERVGIILAHGVGYSPDGLVGEDGCVEVKSALPHIQIDRLLAGTIPSEHVNQVQGGLWVSGRQWCDFISWSPGLRPLIVRVERDEERIAQIAEAVRVFRDEMAGLMERVAA